MGFASLVLLLEDDVSIVHEINGDLLASVTWRVISRGRVLGGHSRVGIVHGGHGDRARGRMVLVVTLAHAGLVCE
jgi:hypothetical protein